jgi:hypothetical protein
MILHKGGTAYIPLAKLPAEIRDQLLTAREVKPTVTPAATIPTTPASTNIVEAAPAQLSLPVLGDETSIAEVISDPAKWQDKWFVASGVTKTNSIFLYGSAFSPDTHYSLRFEPVTADARSGNILTVYAKREAAGPLVAAITKSQPGGKPMPVRLKIKITAHCFLFGKYQEMAELVDWQLLKDDRASWADWALGAK